MLSNESGGLEGTASPETPNPGESLVKLRVQHLQYNDLLLPTKRLVIYLQPRNADKDVYEVMVQGENGFTIHCWRAADIVTIQERVKK